MSDLSLLHPTSAPPGSLRSYDAWGARLRVHATDPEVHRSAAAVLRHKGVAPIRNHAAPSPESPVLDLFVERTGVLPPLPDGAERLGRCIDTPIEGLRWKKRLYFQSPNACAVVDAESGTARLSLTPAFDVREPRGPTRLFTHLLGFLLVGLLRPKHWYPLHAAVLVRNGRGLVLLAESDAGKSTTAFQLVRNGWSYVSDDNVLLRMRGDAVEAVSMRPEFCLDAGAADHFPQLRRHAWPPMVQDESKWRVDVNRLYPGRFAASCLPRVLVLPSIADQPASSVGPITATDLLPSLLRQTAFSLTTGPQASAAHLALLGRLLQQCTTYRLSSGRDGLGDGAAVSAQLAALVDEASGGSADEQERH